MLLRMDRLHAPRFLDRPIAAGSIPPGSVFAGSVFGGLVRSHASP